MVRVRGRRRRVRGDRDRPDQIPDGREPPLATRFRHDDGVQPPVHAAHVGHLEPQPRERVHAGRPGDGDLGHPQLRHRGRRGEAQDR